MARHPQPATRGDELGAARCGGAVRTTRSSRSWRGRNAPRSVTRKGRRFLRRSSLMTTRPKKSKLVVVHLNSNIPQDRLPHLHALRRPITGFLAGRARRSTVVKVPPQMLAPKGTPRDLLRPKILFIRFRHTFPQELQCGMTPAE